ncbi:MAG: hypothetical protein IPN24_19455 [Betaproteobacteria bacterium]|nr:hypothetical protein [Betaproteobacteria bacterium]
MTLPRLLRISPRFLIGCVLAGLSIAAVPAHAQPAAAATPGAGASAGPLAPLAWLAGCWRGTVNQREFREQWMPLRGGLMVGVSHTLNGDRTQNFEYLRLESRADGVHYVAAPSGRDETAFRLAAQTRDGDDEIFNFANPVDVFPQTIIYRRGTKGWLYAHVEGKVNGAEQKVIYPMRRVDCETGENIEK